MAHDKPPRRSGKGHSQPLRTALTDFVREWRRKDETEKCRTYLVIKLAGKGKFRGQQRQFLRFLVLVCSRCAVRGPTNRGGRNEKSVRHQSPQCGHGLQGASRAPGSNAELGALKGNLRGAGLHPRLYVSR